MEYYKSADLSLMTPSIQKQIENRKIVICKNEKKRNLLWIEKGGGGIQKY